jgi:phage shock protein PspC (stress-responsive transcriptional regulator)
MWEMRRSGETAWRHTHGISEGTESIMNNIHNTFRQEGLIRPREGRILGGVCAGLGRRFGIAPWPARLLFILILMVLPGSQLLIYPILWILMPSESAPPVPVNPAGPPGTYPTA